MHTSPPTRPLHSTCLPAACALAVAAAAVVSSTYNRHPVNGTPWGSNPLLLASPASACSALSGALALLRCALALVALLLSSMTKYPQPTGC